MEAELTSDQKHSPAMPWNLDGCTAITLPLRLAVPSALRGHGLGRNLLFNALRRSLVQSAHFFGRGHNRIIYVTIS